MRLLAIFTVCLLAFSGTAKAEMSYVVVSVQQIMQEASAMESIRKQIESKRQEYQAAITEQEEELRAKDQELAEQRAILSPEAMEEKKREFRSELTEVQRDVQIKRAELDRAYGKATNQVKKAILDIVDELADEKGFNLALPASQVLYGKPSLDITDQVLSRLNEKLPDVKVVVEKIEAPAQ